MSTKGEPSLEAAECAGARSGDEESQPPEGASEVQIAQGGAESLPVAAAAPPPITKVLKLARPELPILCAAVVFMVISEGLFLYLPLLFAGAVDSLIDPGLGGPSKMSYIGRTVALAVAVCAGGTLAMFLRSSLMGVAGERIAARVRISLYSNILRQDMSFFDEQKTGELVSRLGTDTSLLQLAASSAVPDFSVGAVKTAVCIAVLFFVSPELAGVTTGFTLTIVSVSVPFGRMIGGLAKSYLDAIGRAQDRSTEVLGAMRTVQSFAAEDRERVRYEEAVGGPDSRPRWWQHGGGATAYGAGVSKSVWTAAYSSSLFGVCNCAWFATLWYGFKLVVDGRISTGDVLAFYFYIVIISSGLIETSASAAKLMEARGASARVFHLLERVPAIPASPKGGGVGVHRGGGGRHDGMDDAERGEASEDGGTLSPPGERTVPPLRPPSMEGEIEFRAVSFSYPSRPDVPVLKDFTLRVPPNTTAAIVGPSGSGKSTVVALIQRFYDVDGGSVAVDGNDVRDLDLRWLRERIGYVQQEPQLFGTTVAENVGYGVDGTATEVEVEAACREANAHDFVSGWPRRYGTLVGERGVKLSGGQKQRLAVARALLTDPRILLLDEATSALDAESERLVQEAIERAMVGRTVIVVAHRLSTIRGADQIVVLDGNQIVDMGTHEILLERCGKYQDLIRRQTA